MPGHLDGFEFGFVGGGGVAGEERELGDPFVHVGEADGEGIGVGVFVGQGDGDVFDVVPAKVGGILLLSEILLLKVNILKSLIRIQ